MKTSAPPPPAASLAPQLYFQLVHTMTDLLPPPLDDSPAALRARNHAAIAKAASMLPVNADETDLAAQCVVARAQAEDVMRLIRENAQDIKLVMRLNAQYALMVRTSLSARSSLLRVQAVRHKREAIEATADQDARTRHVVEQCMLIVADPDTGRPRAASPGAAREEVAGAARGEVPQAAREEAPQATREEAPRAPQAAPAEAPVALPALDGDQATGNNVSEYDTNSRDMAFETWVREQIDHQGPDETGLRKRVLEAMAGSLLAGQALSPNGCQSS